MDSLKQLAIELDREKLGSATYQKASLLHGVLIERMSNSYAEKMHREGMRPYSQCLFKSEDGKLTWLISTLNSEAAEEIITPLINPDIGTVYIKHNEETLNILAKEMRQATIYDLVQNYYFGNCKRYVTLQFKTPTAFKQNGKYIFYPNPGLIFKSLMNRFDSFAENETVGDEEVLETLISNTDITSYKLRSSYFPLEGVKIPAFCGTVRFKISGPQPLVNFAHLLLRYGEYSGVGIKTALGMGKMDVLEMRRIGN